MKSPRLSKTSTYGIDKAREFRTRRKAASRTAITHARKAKNPSTIDWYPLRSANVDAFDIDWSASLEYAHSLLAKMNANTFTMLRMPTGAGKTAVVVAALGLRQRELDKQLPFIIVAPRAVVEQKGWHKTIAAWNDTHPTERLDPLMIDKPDHFANVCDHAVTLKDTIKALGSDGVVVLDEAHAYKSPTSKRSKTLQRLHARTIVGLSATPLTNDIIHDTMSYLIKNRMYTSKTAFYRESGLDMFRGERGRLLVYNDDQTINRQLWPYVDTMLEQLSDVIYSPQIDMSTLDMPSVKSIVTQLDVDPDVDTKLRSINAAYRAGAFESPVDTSLAIMDAICESPVRLKALTDIVTAPDVHQPLVFYWHTSTLNILKQQLDASGIEWQEISGATSIEDVDFNLDTVILVQYQAGAEGVEMKNSNTTVFYENQYSVSRLDQAKGRNVRRGQSGTTTQYTLLSHTSFETRIVERLIAKKDVNDEVLTKIIDASLG